MRQDGGAPEPAEFDNLRRLLREAFAPVAFTGAGISTAAGIPDFRSPGGLWSQMEPITFQHFCASASARLEDWRRRFVMNEQFERARPTVGHLVLAEMVRSGRMPAIITQNIDGLHQRSGVAANRLVELHGNATFGHCIECRLPMDLESVRAEIDRTGRCPACTDCGGLIKAAVVSFGEAMPEAAMATATELCRNADLILAIGTSLQVQPAASLPQIGIRLGAKLVIINKQSTPLDGIAELVLNHSIDSVFAALSPQLLWPNRK